MPQDTTHLTVAESKNVTIKNNNISNGDGFYLVLVEESDISNNNLLNTVTGFWMSESSNNTLRNNNVSNNKWGGISVVNSANNNTLMGNNVSDNSHSFSLYRASNSTIANNYVSDNWRGIKLEHRTYDNLITDNILCYNEESILLESSNNNTIFNNTIYSSDEIGIRLKSSSYNQIYHNDFIDNEEQAYDDGESNSWDKGPVIGGNYWNDHTCTGNPSDGSQPYYIDADSIDHYPFEDRIHNVTLPPAQAKSEIHVYKNEYSYLICQ